jgi:cytochrome c-type biogenesis protein CcmH
MKRILLALCLGLALHAAVAREAAPLAADPVAEKRLIALSAELRCLVCQNQSIADSNAELAQDLRREIRTMIAAGKSDKEIVEFMVQRYGDFVLYNPPMRATTLFLWGGPLIFMVGGLWALAHYLRRRSRQELADDVPLSAEEAERAKALLKDRQE